VLVLDDVKRARGVVKTNHGASLVDLGEGVLCLEFHSKMNALGDEMIHMVTGALDVADRGFAALVVANDGENFSVGANLLQVLHAAKEGAWEELETSVRRFQAACMAMKYASRPVVSAAFGLALGGGCEVGVACRPRRSVGGNLYGPGGDRRRPGSGGRRV
jgi:3-hydroxyacyl-CoA dehydrogenase